MALTTMTALVLALAPVGAPGLESTTAPPNAAARTAEGYDDLVREFDAAYEAWKAAYREADTDERKALRDRDPVELYWPRFVAAGEAGEGRALLWQLDNLRKAGLSRSERDAREPVLLTELVEEHREADWFGGALEELGPRAQRDPAMLALLELVATGTENGDNRAHAMVLLGDGLLSAADAEAQERGKTLLETVRAEHPDTEWAEAARIRLAAENLKPGRVAPDFTARTIEGFEFDLSGYRGKVVLIDFYGFW
jgi:hypothetical protein